MIRPTNDEIKRVVVRWMQENAESKVFGIDLPHPVLDCKDSQVAHLVKSIAYLLDHEATSENPDRAWNAVRESRLTPAQQEDFDEWVRQHRDEVDFC